MRLEYISLQLPSTFSLKEIVTFPGGLFCVCERYSTTVSSYFHTRGHVPDDLILEACRKGPFVFKGHAQKRSTRKA